MVGIDSRREMRNRFDLRRQGSKPRQVVGLESAFILNVGGVTADACDYNPI